jgi:hypothetical protein
MFMNKINPIITATLALSLTVWAACKKDNTSSSATAAQDDTAMSLSSSGTTGQAAYGDVFNEVMSTGESNNLNTSVVGQTGNMGATTEFGKTVSLSPDDTDTYPKTLTIDYGAGDTSAAGVVRSGELIVTLSGRLIDAGTTVSVRFNQYKVAGVGLSGTYSFTNNTTGNGLSYTTQVTGGGLTLPSGASYTYSEQDTLVQTAGVGTSTFADDAYTITGDYNLASSVGNTLTAKVTTPLIREFTCANIVSGVVSFTYDGIVKGTLDYGAGTCDDEATLTVGLKSQTVTLP